MSRVAVINCSHVGNKAGQTIYNLAVHKIGNYHRDLGDEVYAGPWAPMLLQKYEKFYFSVIFTWDIPEMIRAVNMVRDWGKDVEIGGPAATFMHKYIHTQTGISPHCGIDPRFEHVPGQYEMTFTSRGCPHHCPFCGVRKVEPVSIEYEDFPLAPIIGDNNILATSWDHQVMVVNKLVDFGREIDINSGFDIRFFQEKHYELYSRLRLQYWRFAFDTIEVEEDVRRVAAIMRNHGLDRHQVTFYVLINFPGQTPEECHYRMRTIIDLGMNPYCLAKGTPLLTSVGLKNIEDIHVGDEVLGGDGYFHKVVDSMKRAYSGDMVTILPKGINLSMTVTGDHKIPVVNSGEVLLKEARALNEHDKLQLISPRAKPQLGVPSYPSSHKNLKRIPEVMTPDFVRLIGYYLAEGSLHRTSARWMFNDTNKRAWAEDIGRIATSLGLNSSIRPLSHHGLEVSISSRALMYAIEQLCGRKLAKFVSPQLFQLPDDMLWELVTGYFRGDGSLSLKEGRWRVTASSVSPSLAIGFVLILSRLGLTPRISLLHSKKEHRIHGQIIKAPKVMYQIGLGLGAEVRELALRVWGKSIAPWPSHHHRYERIFGNSLIPIKALTQSRGEAEVYNITVAETHDYAACGLLVNNCMRFTPLNSLTRHYVAPGWSEELLQRMVIYYITPYVWMSDTWENFRPGKKIPETQSGQRHYQI